MLITAADHINIRVKDVEATVAFYQGVQAHRYRDADGAALGRPRRWLGMLHPGPRRLSGGVESLRSRVNERVGTANGEVAAVCRRRENVACALSPMKLNGIERKLSYSARTN